MSIENFNALLKGVLANEKKCLREWYRYTNEEQFSEEEIQEALRLTNQALTENRENPYALCFRAYMHQHGQGGPVNYPEAIRLYEQAIDLNYAVAMNNRAYMHRTGEGGAVNTTEAIRLYEQAIALKHPNPMYNRACMHQTGKGGAVNITEAIRLYELAIDLNQPNAMYNRACMHQTGEGGAVNYDEATELFHRAYKQNIKESLSKLEEIAQVQNHIKAQYYLTLIYLAGNGVPQDEKTATQWIRKHPREIAELIYDDVIQRLDNKQDDQTQLLLDFAIDKNPSFHLSETLKYIQFKVLIQQAESAKALHYYNNQLPLSCTSKLTGTALVKHNAPQLICIQIKKRTPLKRKK